MKNVEYIQFPLFWLDETGSLSEEDGETYDNTVNFGINLVTGLTITFGLILGIALFGLGVFFCWKA